MPVTSGGGNEGGGGGGDLGFQSASGTNWSDAVTAGQNSWGHTVPAITDGYVFVALSTWNGSEITNASFAGVTLSYITNSSPDQAQLWGGPVGNLSAGEKTVTVGVAGGTETAISCAVYTNAAQSDALRSVEMEVMVVDNASTNTTLTTASGDVFFCAVASAQMASTSNAEEIHRQSNPSGYWSSYLYQTNASGSSTTIELTLNATCHLISTALKPK